MARSLWTGVISFGLVSVPVALYSATHEHEVSFHLFEKGTSDRIRYHRVNERTGKEVDYDDIVKGAEVGDGQYVMLDPDELDAIAPGRSRALDIYTFVDLDDIDPVYYQKPYYLGPGSEETAKTYALLRDAMAHANRAAIGTLVMRNKQYLVAIRPHDDLLVLETMYFADEVRDPQDQIDDVPGKVRLRPEELKMATQLIESMSGAWKPTEYRDTYTDRVKDLIDAKKRGDEVVLAEEAPEATRATDLMDVLRASVEAAKQGRSGKKAAPAKKAAPGKKSTAAARSTTSKKAAPGKKATAGKKAAPGKKAASPAKKSAGKKSTSRSASGAKSTRGNRSTATRKAA